MMMFLPEEHEKQMHEPEAKILCYGDLQLDARTGSLSANGQRIALPRLEYRMMELLMLHCDTPISSDELLTGMWGPASGVEVGAVWVYITYLRKRLTALGSQVEIRAKRSVGYTLCIRA